MIEIDGKIVEGEKSASGIVKNWNGYGSIYHQVNFLKDNYPLFFKKISSCKMATINVVLNKNLILDKWEYVFDKVFWLPNSNTWYEEISFTPILFVYNNTTFEAWLYKADKSPHKNCKNCVEIISPLIESLEYNRLCKIKIKADYVK